MVFMNMPKKMNIRILLAFTIFSLTRIAIFFFSKNYEGDAAIRIKMALKWIDDPFFISHSNSVTWVFGSLYYYIHGFAFYIFNNPVITPRIVSLILGVLTFIPFYLIVKKQVNEEVAFYSSLFFSFYTLHVRYSTVATSEAIYIFVLLTAICFFLYYLSKRKLIYLILTILFMILISFTAVGLGLIFASKMRDMQTFPLIMNLIVMPLLLVSSAFFPLKNLPPQASTAALFNPLFYMVDGLRGSLLGKDYMFLPIIDLSVVFVLCIVMIFLGSYFFSKSEA